MLRLRSDGLEKELCAWKGTNSISAFVAREEKVHILQLLGEDTSTLGRRGDTTRQEKARRAQQQADDQQEEKEAEA